MPKSSPSPSPVPSLQSRHPRSATKQAQLDSAKEWLAAGILTASTCPVSTVTEIIKTDTGVGKTLLSKYDTAKLQVSYSMTRTMERIHMVEDLRQDVGLRWERAGKWREVMAMAAREQGTGDDGESVMWDELRTACQKALENTEQLQARLKWCEQNFEAGKLTPAVVAGQRVWYEGAESGSQEPERGRSTIRE